MKKILKLVLSIAFLPTLFSCGQNGHVHSYSEPTWAWTDYTSAKATFKCSTCSEVVVLYDNQITSYQDPIKSCFVDGVWNYVASVTLDGNVYTSRKTVSDPATNKHGDLLCIPFDDEMHQYKCSVCGEIIGQKKTHSYGEYVTKKEPTYTTEGVKERTCSECGHTQVSKIEKLKLSYAEVKPILTSANNQSATSVYADSYYIDALEKYTYADINNFSKEQADEINNLKSSIESKYNTWKQSFGLVYQGKNMGYNDVTTTTALDDVNSKGMVTAIKSTLSSGEGWAYSVLMPTDIDDYKSITFSVYFDQPTDMLVMNTDWTIFLDLLTDTVYKNPVKPHTTSIEAKQWVTFTISKVNWLQIDGITLNMYLTHNLDYGVRTTGKPAYLTNIYGVK